MFGLDGQGLRKNKTGKLMIRGCGEGYMKRPFQIGMGCEDISALCINAHERANSFEEKFNNQVSRMTHSVDSSWPLSPATLVTG